MAQLTFHWFFRWAPFLPFLLWDLCHLITYDLRNDYAGVEPPNWKKTYHDSNWIFSTSFDCKNTCKHLLKCHHLETMVKTDEFSAHPFFNLRNTGRFSAALPCGSQPWPYVAGSHRSLWCPLQWPVIVAAEAFGGVGRMVGVREVCVYNSFF